MIETARILLFMRVPTRGKVKTRLAGSLGTDAALDLYDCFVRDTIDAVARSGMELHIYYYLPPESSDDAAALVGTGRILHPQEGADLGERMANAFGHAFADGVSSAILIGSDVPDLPGGIFATAVEALASHDAVLGPAADGGYYLIGFRRDSFTPEIFSGIAWGSDSAYESTEHNLQHAGRSFFRLPAWRDVDTAADLEDLYLRNRNSPFACSRTMRYLIGNADRFFSKEARHAGI